MNHPLFEQIDNAGLTVNGSLNFKAISKMTAFDIVEFALQSKELTLTKNIVQQEGFLTHTASFSLGGSSWPCGEIGCRIKKIGELAQFAAFYSDRIYIHNFFVDHLKHLESGKYPHEGTLRYIFANDLVVLQHIRPLIEAEIIVPVTPLQCCPQCFTQNVLHHDSDKRFANAIMKLANRYAKELTYTISKDTNGLCTMVMKGPDDLVEHSSSVLITPDQPPKHYRQLRKQLNQGIEVKISRKDVEKMGLNLNMTDHVSQNIIFELLVAQSLNTSYVTERPIDIDLLNDITTDNMIQQRSRIIYDNLTCLVPFANDISAIDVLKLREAEQEAFIRFRQALNKALNESLSSNPEFGANEARQVYQDIIRPELCNLESKMKQGYKSLFRDTAFEIGAWSAAIGIGLYSGIVPEALAPAAKAIGLTKVLAEFGKGILNKSHPESEIKDADMYFLWKVRQGVKQ